MVAQRCRLADQGVCVLRAGRARRQVTRMGNKGTGGPFAPIVVVVKDAMGQKEFNKLRGKAISIHSGGAMRHLLPWPDCGATRAVCAKLSSCTRSIHQKLSVASRCRPTDQYRPPWQQNYALAVFSVASQLERGHKA